MVKIKDLFATRCKCGGKIKHLGTDITTKKNIQVEIYQCKSCKKLYI